MKKWFLLFCSVLLILSSMLIACTSDNQNETNENGNEKIEVRGRFYLLEVAYDNSWLNENDLKSIACSYNDFQQKDNPYSGMYEQPTEALSNDVENELKQAYLNQIAEYPDGLLENVQINYYYGTYNGNIVIRIYSDYLCIDPMIKEEVYIGSVTFKGYWDAQTWIYHIA